MHKSKNKFSYFITIGERLLILIILINVNCISYYYYYIPISNKYDDIFNEDNSIKIIFDKKLNAELILQGPSLSTAKVWLSRIYHSYISIKVTSGITNLEITKCSNLILFVDTKKKINRVLYLFMGHGKSGLNSMNYHKSLDKSKYAILNPINMDKGYYEYDSIDNVPQNSIDHIGNHEREIFLIYPDFPQNIKNSIKFILKLDFILNNKKYSINRLYNYKYTRHDYVAWGF